MPIPSPNLSPEFNIVRLSHVELRVRDLDWSRRYYVDLLGLQVTHEGSDALYLRAMEERGHHSVILRQASTPSVGVLGFKVWSEADLDKAQMWFTARGLPTRWIERPFMGRVLATRDPWGVPLEFYTQMERLSPIHQQYKLYRGVKPLRIDHFNLFSSNVDQAVQFYSDMGFRLTEYTSDQDSGRLWAAWMHRKGGVHDIAFTNGTGPRLHHTAFWVPTPLNIIDLLDLMSTSGYLANVERGPGRHGISNAFFLYIRDQDGHRTEIYCSDYQTCDPDQEPIHWDLKDPQRQTLWGAPAPKSWFELGSVFDGAVLADSDLQAQPIVAP